MRLAATAAAAIGTIALKWMNKSSLVERKGIEKIKTRKTTHTTCNIVENVLRVWKGAWDFELDEHMHNYTFELALSAECICCWCVCACAWAEKTKKKKKTTGENRILSHMVNSITHVHVGLNIRTNIQINWIQSRKKSTETHIRFIKSRSTELIAQGEIVSGAQQLNTNRTAVPYDARA